MQQQPYLIVGLGNPGPDYAGHRHNVGFMAVDALAEALSAEPFSKKFHGEIAAAELTIPRRAEGRVSPASPLKLFLLKPHTYMNHSGRAVQAAAAFYKIPPAQIIVLQDEIDLGVGKLRIKQGGGANGQNGIRDIDAAIGPDYWRIRLGIGRPPHGTVHSHVLSNFSKDEQSDLEKILAALAQHFAVFFSHSPAALMSKVSEATQPPREKNAKPVDKAQPAN